VSRVGGTLPRYRTQNNVFVNRSTAGTGLLYLKLYSAHYWIGLAKMSWFKWCIHPMILCMLHLTIDCIDSPFLVFSTWFGWYFFSQIWLKRVIKWIKVSRPIKSFKIQWNRYTSDKLIFGALADCKERCKISEFSAVIAEFMYLRKRFNKAGYKMRQNHQKFVV